MRVAELLGGMFYPSKVSSRGDLDARVIPHKPVITGRLVRLGDLMRLLRHFVPRNDTQKGARSNIVQVSPVLRS